MLVFLITFIVLLIVIATVHHGDDKAWIRALIIAIVFTGVSWAANTFGIPGWAVGGVIGLIIIMKTMNYSFGAAFFFTIIVTILQTLVGLGVERYIKI